MRESGEKQEVEGNISYGNSKAQDESKNEGKKTRVMRQRKRKVKERCTNECAVLKKSAPCEEGTCQELKTG